MVCLSRIQPNTTQVGADAPTYPSGTWFPACAGKTFGRLFDNLVLREAKGIRANGCEGAVRARRVGKPALRKDRSSRKGREDLARNPHCPTPPTADCSLFNLHFALCDLKSLPPRHFPLDNTRTNVLLLLPKPYCGAGSLKDRKRWGVGTSPHYLPCPPLAGRQ